MQTLKKIALGLAFVPLMALAQDMDAEKRAAIKDLMEVTQADKQIKGLADNAQAQSKQEVFPILDQSLGENKKLSDKQKQAAVEKLKKGPIQKLQDQAGKVFTTDAFRADANKVHYDVYAKNYSTQELREITAFFKTPSGQKFLSTQDKTLQEILGTLMQKYLPQARKATHDAAEKEIAAASK